MVTTLPIVLTLALCFGGPHCRYSHPVAFPTWQACAEAGASMMAHSRRVGSGMVAFTCKGMGGK